MSIATPLEGPRPGKAPIIVPSTQPAIAKLNVVIVRATLKPSIKFSTISILSYPNTARGKGNKLSPNPNLKIKISGDKSLNGRDMKRITEPLSKIGCIFKPKHKKTLPLIVQGTSMPLAQTHIENIGSAQVKSSILMAALDTPGITVIKEEKISRNHTENLLSAIGADIVVKKDKKYNLISLRGQKDMDCFKFKIPGDPSSSAFFIALALLTKGSRLYIKNVNLNPLRIGFIKILKKMNANIKIKNLKRKFNEPVGDIVVKSSKLKPINFPKSEVSSTIDEFPILFVIASQIKGISNFSNIGELRKKESDRIKNIEIVLKKIGIRTISTKNSLKIFGNPKVQIKKSIQVYSKDDHRIAMSFFCLGQLLGGKIQINNFETVNTSFPKFLTLMKNKIGAKFEIKKKY